ncbi:SusD/RagB family nutrient-binding outer membrane lipoprotein [Bacteroides reticulotermitis]|uniref:SusD/RagB family nutrient-binding outer membrane lipoprotein n=1 Tax=Bacteroides reticulotermitis TaxID=1133319 RepID=UPI003A887655
MKRIYIPLLLATFVAFTLTSCNDELADINRNPNATENPQPAYLLSAAEYHAANLYWGSTTSYNSSLLWIQHWAKIQYTEPDCYNVSNSDFATTWDTGYATLVANLTAILQSDLSNDNYKGVALVWRSWTYLLLTNLFGDIPYTEYGQSVTPAYDSQETVLRGVLSDLEEADKLLTVSGEKIEGDLIYKNDISRWKKLAKSLRLRIGLELGDRDENTAKKIISTLYEDRSNLINSNEDIAQFVFTSSPQWNPWASAFSSRDDQRISKTLVDKLNAWSDPRVGVYAQLPQDVSVKTYVGAANGLSADAANNQGFYKLSLPGTSFLKDSAPAVFYTYAEVLFIYAEAAARGWITADANSLYQQAITASLNQFGVSNEDVIEEYLQQEGVQYDASRWFEKIGWQKWIAYYGQGPDAFTDWRRLGYPQLAAGPNSALNAGELPRRFFYPATEQSLNGKNYRLAVAHQGADEITTRLWFDVEKKNR